MRDWKPDTEKDIADLRRVLLQTKGTDRRTFIRALGQTAVGAAILSSLGPLGATRARAQANAVTHMAWGGAWQDAMFESTFRPFTEATGIPVNYVTPYSFAQLQAMHDANQMEIDFISAGVLDRVRVPRQGMNAPIDWSGIDRSQFSPNQLEVPDSIGGHTVSNVLVYNKRKWPGDDHPKSLADFWDVERFPGPRSLQRRCYPTFETAAIAMTGSTNRADIYPLDVPAILAKLDEIKPHISVWFESGAQQQQLVLDEEVDLIVMWNGRAADTIFNAGADYGIVWNDATLYPHDIYVVMQGAPNPEGALAAIDFAGRAEPQAVFARLLYYGPSNLMAYEYLDDELGANLPTHPDNAARALEVDFDWWIDVFDEHTRTFETWLQS